MIDDYYNITKDNQINPDNSIVILNNVIDDKHSKYFGIYKPNEIYFGLGIENETYLMFDKPVVWKGSTIVKNQKRERYSVNYYDNFKEESIKKFMNMIEKNELYEIPLFLNTHTLVKCDKNNEHRTRYTIKCEPNTKFNGQTIDEMIRQSSKYLADNYDINFVYDGDTLELMTNNFHCATVEQATNELSAIKSKILEELKQVFEKNDIFKQYGELKYQDMNYGLVVHMSNINNIVVCNNGTYHFNITLPTKLNNVCEIEDPIKFRNMHSNAIRAIQWFEPLFVACYGSPDILSCVVDDMARGSLRVALSRYISIGTYCTQTMENGKQLDNYKYNNTQTHWFKRLHDISSYIPPKNIGYDVNYNKFRNHGIEIRFFDQFPEKYLKDVLNIIVLLCEYSLNHDIPDIHSKYYQKVWEPMAIECIMRGSVAKISDLYIETLEEIFIGNKDKKYADLSAKTVFQTIVNQLYANNSDGEFVRLISPNMQRPIVVDHNNDMYMTNMAFIKDKRYIVQSDQNSKDSESENDEYVITDWYYSNNFAGWGDFS
jgi:hypothetical protein